MMVTVNRIIGVAALLLVVVLFVVFGLPKLSSSGDSGEQVKNPSLKPLSSKYRPPGSKTTEEYLAERGVEVSGFAEAGKALGMSLRVPANTRAETATAIYAVTNERAPERPRYVTALYPSFEIAEIALSSDEEGLARIDDYPGGFDDRYMKRLEIDGHRGIGLKRAMIAVRTRADGSVEPGVGETASTVAWVEGKKFMRISSETLSLEQLIVIAESMY